MNYFAKSPFHAPVAAIVSAASAARNNTEACAARLRTSSTEWVQCVVPPSPASIVVNWARDNSCGFVQASHDATVKALFAATACEFYGDSTLREIVSVMLKFLSLFPSAR